MLPSVSRQLVVVALQCLAKLEEDTDLRMRLERITLYLDTCSCDG
jgi:hypothetical protein